jgi:hypothetical protein
MVRRSEWRVLDLPLRLSVVLGTVVDGSWIIYFGITVVGPFIAGAGLTANDALLLLYPYTLFFLVFPLASLACSLRLLVSPVSEEKRGILGLISLAGSIAPAIILVQVIFNLVLPPR